MRGSASGARSEAARLMGASPFSSFASAVDGLGFGSNVDDFLDELRWALDDTGVPPSANRPRRPPAEVSASAANTMANANANSNAFPTPAKATGKGGENGCFFALGSANGPPSRLPDSSKLPAWRRDSLGGSATPSAGLPRESLGFDLLSPINNAGSHSNLLGGGASSASDGLASSADMQQAMQNALMAASTATSSTTSGESYSDC